MSKIIGYARVSTVGQNLEAQEKILKDNGATIILADKASGTSRDNREKLDLAIQILEPEDTLLITRLDRLARSVMDLSNIVQEITNKGAYLRATEQEFSTSSATGKLTLNILASMAEFETQLRAERQKEGITNAKSKGVKFGRTEKLTDDMIKEALELQSQGLTQKEIAEKFDVGHSTLRNRLSKYKKENNLVTQRVVTTIQGKI